MGKPAVSLSDHALDNLSYIRSAMERASSFTAVPGVGGIGMGLTALLAAFLAPRQMSREAWLTVWMVAAGIAVLIGAATMVRKARRSRVALLAEPGRKFALSFTPPLAVGAVLTLPVFLTGNLQLLAAMWLLLYGAAILAGSSHSAVVVPAMGASFLVLGVVTLIGPAAWRDMTLAAGFGGLHIIFGWLIYRRYGG